MKDKNKFRQRCGCDLHDLNYNWDSQCQQQGATTLTKASSKKNDGWLVAQTVLTFNASGRSTRILYGIYRTIVELELERVHGRPGLLTTQRQAKTFTFDNIQYLEQFD